MISIILGLALTAAVGCVVFLALRIGRERASVQQAKRQSDSLQRELGGLRRASAQLEAQLAVDQRFVTDFLRELPHVARELHSGVTERGIPGILLNILMRALAPEQAVVLIRRKPRLGETVKPKRLVVAASSHKDLVPLGTELDFGSGELGWVAEVQRVMTRQDFESQTLMSRRKLEGDSLPGLVVELAAPMLFGDETLGVIAISRPRHASAHAKDALRVVAQIGGLALRNAAAYSDVKLTADMDGLTLVYNKRYMTTALGEAVYRSQQRVSSVSAFLFDIDNFKHYNDTNGHDAGDQLLKLLARLVRENTRSENIFGRFGGEEFLIVLPDTTSAEALQAAEAIRAVIASHPFPHAEKQPLGCISISGGVAECPTDALDSASLLRAADRALYAAKRQGRNRVLAIAPRFMAAGAEEVGTGTEHMASPGEAPKGRRLGPTAWAS
ncbi:MAG TPA: sensor domain-containing diguanylate cyclase [Vicinamibacteria bacterium]|nr:sensor domain-containing diguanylate cyclase [Vicinamibacteria bacterium]